jgi:hypothetical protein
MTPAPARPGTRTRSGPPRGSAGRQLGRREGGSQACRLWLLLTRGAVLVPVKSLGSAVLRGARQERRGGAPRGRQRSWRTHEPLRPGRFRALALAGGRHGLRQAPGAFAHLAHASGARLRRGRVGERVGDALRVGQSARARPVRRPRRRTGRAVVEQNLTSGPDRPGACLDGVPADRWRRSLRPPGPPDGHLAGPSIPGAGEAVVARPSRSADTKGET